VTPVTVRSISAALRERLVQRRRRMVRWINLTTETTMLKCVFMLAIAALALPMAAQAGASGSRAQVQPVQAHSAKNVRMPAMNHAPNVTLKRGAIGSLN
jgi:hypothetical protein